MKKKINNEWFTLIEVIISVFIISTLFAAIYSGTQILINYIEESNQKLIAASLVKSWIEKINIYSSYYKVKNSDNSWNNFINETWTWYFVFSWSNVYPTSTNYDFNLENWEWPLDKYWNLKENNEGISYYRILKLADYDVMSNNSLKLNNNIFDIDDWYLMWEITSDWLIKNPVSYPILKKIDKNWNTLDLIYSWGYSIFWKKTIFILWEEEDLNDLSYSEWNFSVWKISNDLNVWLIDFSWFSWTWDLNETYLTLSWTTLWFWTWDINIPFWSDLDESIYNLYLWIKNQNNKSVPLIFYANRCTISSMLNFYDNINNKNINLSDISWDRCLDVSLNINWNKLTLSWSVIWELWNYYLNPWSNLKLFLWDNLINNDYKIFSELISDKTWSKWTKINSWTWVSSIYVIWSKVLWVEWGFIKFDESYDSYFWEY